MYFAGEELSIISMRKNYDQSLFAVILYADSTATIKTFSNHSVPKPKTMKLQLHNPIRNSSFLM